MRDWMPGIVTGMLQTADYARALIAAVPRTSPEVAAARLASRMDRQRRVLLREDDPPAAWFLVDEMALYRKVGTAEVMAAQMRQLSVIAAMAKVTLQVLPAVAHPANASGFVIADDSAAYAEHVAGGYVFTDEQTVSAIMVRFDSLRAESHRASESLQMISKAGERWTAGVSPLTPTGTADSA